MCEEDSGLIEPDVTDSGRRIVEVSGRASSEMIDIAATALNVTHQSTERLEFGFATVEPRRAAVHMIIVDRAVQVVIKRLQSSELLAEEEAFISSAIEGSFCCVSLDYARFEVIRSHEKMIRTGDDVVAVVLPNESVDTMSVNTGTTEARFEM